MKLTNEDGLPEDLTKGPWPCPRCSQIANGYPATSRRDNKTFICSNCGSQEAIFDLLINEKKVTQKEIDEERKWLE